MVFLSPSQQCHTTQGRNMILHNSTEKNASVMQILLWYAVSENSVSGLNTIWLDPVTATVESLGKQRYWVEASANRMFCSCSLAVLDPRVGHTMDVLSPFIPVRCHSDWLFHGESCPRLDVVHPSRAWPSSPSCTWHCSLHYLFLQATPLFPHCVTIVC